MLKKISILIKGNLIAHIFTLIALVVLPKIYDPDQFGLLATFIGISNILFILLTGRYERALLLPKSDKEAKVLFIFTILLSIFLFIVFFLITVLFSPILGVFFDQKFMIYYIYLVPFYALLLALSETSTYFLNRYEDYKKMAISKVVLTFSLLFCSIVSGLIFGEIISRLIALIYMLRINLIHFSKKQVLPTWKELKSVATKYKDFPMKSLSGGIIGMISNSIPLMIIGKLFSLEIAGYYLLAYKLLGLPAALLSKSISHVYYKHAILEQKANNLYHFVFKTTLVLSVVSFSLLIIFYVIIDPIINMLFSTKWLGLVVIAKIFAPLFAVNFIYTSQSTLLMVKNKLGYELFFNILIFVVLTTLYLSAYCFNIKYQLTFIMSAVGMALIYCMNIFYLIRISKEAL